MGSSRRSRGPLLAVLALPLALLALWWSSVDADAPREAVDREGAGVVVAAAEEMPDLVEVVTPEAAAPGASRAEVPQESLPVPTRELDPAVMIVEVFRDSAPVEGATVRFPTNVGARFVGPAPGGGLPHEGTTDDGGRARFEVQGIRMVAVVIEVQSEFGTERASRKMASPPFGSTSVLRFDLRDPGAAFEMQVVSLGDGAPVPGAEVQLKIPGQDSSLKRTTDENGRVLVPGEAYSSARVIADGFAVASVTRDEAAPGELWVVKVSRYASISGWASLPEDLFPATIRLAVLDFDSNDVGLEVFDARLRRGISAGKLEAPGPWSFDQVSLPDGAPLARAIVVLETKEGTFGLGVVEELRPGREHSLGDPWAAIDLVRATLRYPSGATPITAVPLSFRTAGNLPLIALTQRLVGERYVPIVGAEVLLRGRALPAPVSDGEGGHVLVLEGFDAVAGRVVGPKSASASVALWSAGAFVATTRALDGAFQFDLLESDVDVQVAALRGSGVFRKRPETSVGTAHPITARPGTLDLELRAPD